jgi:trk system potassium uptake protein TrkA
VVANLIEQASTLDVFMKSLELEEDKVIITEIVVEPDFEIVNKKIMDMELPQNVIIGSIIREGKMIVPNGSTEIFVDDKLIIISSKEDQMKVVEAIGGK